MRTPIVMRSDGSVSAMKPTDLKEVAERDERINQLERQCKVLAAEIDRMRPVVDAAIESARGNNDYKGIARIRRVVKIYEAAKEQGNGISTR